MTIKEFYEWAVKHNAENYSLLIGDEDDAGDPNVNYVDPVTEVVIIN